MNPELFKTLFRSKTVKIERIISRGNATPKGKWLRGSQNEWVMLLGGAARLRFRDGRTVALKTGSAVFIRARRAHRVEWTKSGTKTIWLAVHFNKEL